MKIEPPLLPKRVEVSSLPSVSLRVPKHANPGLDAIKNQVRQVGLDKAIGRIDVKMADAIDLANRRLRGSTRARSMQFGMHEESGRMTVRLTDTNTGMVIRDIPPEKFLENAAILKKTGMMKAIIG